MNSVFSNYIKPLQKFINNRYDECEDIFLWECEEEKESYENTPSKDYISKINDAIEKRDVNISNNVHIALSNVLKDFIEIYKAIVINTIIEKQVVEVPDDFFSSTSDTLVAFYNEFRNLSFDVSIDILSWEMHKPNAETLIPYRSSDQMFNKLLKIVETDLHCMIYHIQGSKSQSELIKYNAITNQLLTYAINILTLVYA